MVEHEPRPDDWQPMSVADVAMLLAASTGRWWLSGGMALAEFLGTITRAHNDIDVSVVREDWPRVHTTISPTLAVWTAHNGVLRPLGNSHVDDHIHNLWARPIDGGPWTVQFNLEDVQHGTWRYRRAPQVARPFDQLTWRSPLLNCVQPAVQLLWKSVKPQSKDDHDYDAVIDRLPSQERHWLGHAIRLAHPNSPWANRPELSGVNRR